MAGASEAAKNYAREVWYCFALFTVVSGSVKSGIDNGIWKGRPMLWLVLQGRRSLAPWENARDLYVTIVPDLIAGLSFGLLFPTPTTKDLLMETGVCIITNLESPCWCSFADCVQMYVQDFVQASTKRMW